MTYLFDHNTVNGNPAPVSWAYYVAPGTEPDCTDTTCTAKQTVGTGSAWNPLPWFTDVQSDAQLGHIEDVSNFFGAAASGTTCTGNADPTNCLANVVWIVPNAHNSGHPSTLVPGADINPASEQFAVSIINAIEASPDWDSTALILAWDDWGGQYDQVIPPHVDGNGYGLRVPAILISPYKTKGVDSQTLSFDAFNKFIEQNFLGGQTLDPLTDGRPDSRPYISVGGNPYVRENLPSLGDMMKDFNFNQTPSDPVLVPQLSMPNPIKRGQSVTLTGQYFLPGDTVTIKADCGAPDCPNGIVLSTVKASSTGTISLTFKVPMVTIPKDLEWFSAQGTNPLTYFGVAGSRINGTITG
jgi:phospholipase C